MKIHNLIYSKAKKVSKMECDVLITSVKMLNQRKLVLREGKKNQRDTRLDYCLSPKLTIGLTASCGNAIKERYAIPNRHSPSCQGSYQHTAGHFLAKTLVCSLTLLTIASSFVDTKDQIILTFLMADEMNC